MSLGEAVLHSWGKPWRSLYLGLFADHGNSKPILEEGPEQSISMSAAVYPLCCLDLSKIHLSSSHSRSSHPQLPPLWASWPAHNPLVTMPFLGQGCFTCSLSPLIQRPAAPEVDYLGTSHIMFACWRLSGDLCGSLLSFFTTLWFLQGPAWWIKWR